jgi:hypothetical protein
MASLLYRGIVAVFYHDCRSVMEWWGDNGLAQKYSLDENERLKR